MQDSYRWLGREVAYDGPHVTLVLNEEDYLSAMAHCKVSNPSEWIVGDASSATAHWLQHPTDGLCAVVALQVTTQKRIQIYALLVHEAVHVAQAYFEHIGEHSPAKEQQAYAIQLISQNLMFEYKRQAKRKKVKNDTTEDAL